MKLFKTVFIFAAGAAAGYAIAKNRVELSVNIEPIVERIKDHLAGFGIYDSDCCCCCDDDESCDTNESCCCDQPSPEVTEG